jgi:hypothetical protein
MAKLTGENGQAVGQPLFSSSADKAHELGFVAVSGGRRFRYVQAGASALVVGDALQARVEDTDHDDTAVRATAVGATSIAITTGSGNGALDLNEYADGYAVIDTTPGLGFVYKIASHAAIAASTNGELVLDGETVQVALTTSSKITLFANPYKAVIQHPVTTATNVCVGGAVYAIAAAEYGWIQTWGPGAGLTLGTPGAGLPVTSVGATAGGLTVHSGELGAVAKMMATGRNGKVCPVFWMVG